MQIPSFLQKFGRDIVYISIIGGMLGWIWMNSKREIEWNQVLVASMEQSTRNTTYKNESTIFLIKKSADAYTCESNEKFRGYAISAQKSVVDFREEIKNALVELESGNRKTSPIFASLRLSAQQLCDSLIICVDQDSLKAKLKDFFEQGTSSKFWEIAKCSDTNRSKVAFATLNQKTALAFSLILDYFSQKLAGEEYMGRFNYQPMVSPDNAAIYVGGTYNANIFLSPYSAFTNKYRSITDHIKVLVNKKAISFHNGLAKFSQSYSTPGEKKYTVDIEFKNPLTKEKTIFTKEFGLLVVDSCR
ncbi:MAG: hypothetical protein H7246_12165 [Phycisphaerae bacterium]|nr:hypothetical protein [Saprospiraceae bacterium]